jgi:hypothetical protein
MKSLLNFVRFRGDANVPDYSRILSSCNKNLKRMEISIQSLLISLILGIALSSCVSRRIVLKTGATS